MCPLTVTMVAFNTHSLPAWPVSGLREAAEEGKLVAIQAEDGGGLWLGARFLGCSLGPGHGQGGLYQWCPWQSSAGTWKDFTCLSALPSVGVSVLNASQKLLHAERQTPKVMAYPISAAGVTLPLG